MATPATVRPQPGTGLPPGVEAGPLGPRAVAQVIDSIVPAVLGVLLGVVAPNVSESLQPVLGVVGVVLIIGWLILVLHGIATRAASPGMRLMKQQVVGFYDGRPVGWGRALIRYLIYVLVSGTGLGWIVMIVLMVLHPRKQGWHDLAAKAVVIKERNLAPPRSAQPRVTAQPSQPEPDHAQPQPKQPYDVGSPASAAQGYPPQQQYPPQQDYSQPDAAGRARPAAAPRPPAPQPAVRGPIAPPPGYDLPAAPPAAPASAGASVFVPRPARGPGPGPKTSAPNSYDDQPTRAVPVVPPAPTWVAALDDGREISVNGMVLLGRNPQPQPGEEDAQLIKLADETRTVSKSHLAIGLDAAGLFVVDRGSTNGSTVTTPDGVSTRCQPGDVIYVEMGSIVSIGDHWFEVRQVG